MGSDMGSNDERVRMLDSWSEAFKRNEMTRGEFLGRALAIGVTLGAAGTLLGACGTSSSPGSSSPTSATSAKRGGTLSVADNNPATGIAPYLTNEPGGRTTMQQVCEYLTLVTPALEVVPQLATKWSTTDAKTWTVELRKNVKFHSGKPFGADDVVATFERVIDPKTGCPAASAFVALKKGHTIKVDDHTVNFELDRPVTSFPYLLFTYQTAILPSTWDGSSENKLDGTGPFKMQNFTSGQGATFVRNENYWQPGVPYLDNVNFVYFSDPNAQITALESGAADIVLNITPELALSLQGTSGVKLLTTSSATVCLVGMRVDQKPFEDKRVRQALALSLDRPTLVKGLCGGLADIGNDHVIAPVSPLYKDLTLAQRQQDIAKAKSLLAEAGYPNGLNVGTLTTHDLVGMPRYAQVIQASAKKVGIDMNLRIETDNTFYAHYYTLPFQIEEWIHRAWPTQLYNIAFLPDSPSNQPHWNNPACNSAVAELDSSLDAASQKAAAEKIAEIMNDEVPSVMAYFLNSTRAVGNRVVGQAAAPTDYLDLRRTSVQA